MAKNLQLSGMIHARFESEAAFAKVLGWSRQRVWKITNGKKVPDLFELRDMAGALDRSVTDLVPIFLPSKSTNVDN